MVGAILEVRGFDAAVSLMAGVGGSLEYAGDEHGGFKQGAVLAGAEEDLGVVAEEAEVVALGFI